MQRLDIKLTGDLVRSHLRCRESEPDQVALSACVPLCAASRLGPVALSPPVPLPYVAGRARGGRPPQVEQLTE